MSRRPAEPTTLATRVQPCLACGRLAMLRPRPGRDHAVYCADCAGVQTVPAVSLTRSRITEDVDGFVVTYDLVVDSTTFVAGVSAVFERRTDGMIQPPTFAIGDRALLGRLEAEPMLAAVVFEVLDDDARIVVVSVTSMPSADAAGGAA